MKKQFCACGCTRELSGAMLAAGQEYAFRSCERKVGRDRRTAAVAEARAQLGAIRVAVHVADRAWSYQTYRKIARDLDVTTEYVRSVAVGFVPSKRVMDAFLAEIRRIEEAHA